MRKEENPSISTSIHLMLSLAESKQIPLIMLYLRLRLFSKNKSGYFKNFKFQHREKFLHLPKLRQLGLVDGFKLINHRKASEMFCMAQNEGFSTYFTRVTEDLLHSRSSFSSFLTAVTETYIRKVQDIKSKRGSRIWDHRSHCFVRKQEKKQGQDYLDKLSKKLSSTKFSEQSLSFISRSMIQRFRPISGASIASHRKKTKEMGLTSYFKIKKTADNPHELNLDYNSSVLRNMFYSKLIHKWVQYHPSACTSIITLINNRRHYTSLNLLCGNIRDKEGLCELTADPNMFSTSPTAF